IQKNRHESRQREPRLAHQHNRVEKPPLRVIVPAICEDVLKPIGHERGAEAESEGGGEDEAVSTGEGNSGDDADAAYRDGGEEEGDGDEGGGEFAEDTHHQQKEAGGVAGLAVRAAGEGDDAVVLGEGGERGYGQETREESVEAVGEDAALDAGVEEGAFDFETGDVAGRGDVTDGFHHEDDVDGEQRQHYGGNVFTQMKLAAGAALMPELENARDDAADEETQDDGAGFHDRGAEALADDDGGEDREAETDVFGASPGEGMRGADGRADGEGARFTRRAGTASACPVLEAGFDEGDAD
ncbi:MAG: hypothetical protein Q9218_005279, partial [Villophora microphyllina]